MELFSYTSGTCIHMFYNWKKWYYILILPKIKRSILFKIKCFIIALNKVEEAVMCYELVITADTGIQWTNLDSFHILEYLNTAFYRQAWLAAQTGTDYKMIVKDSKPGDEGWYREKEFSSSSSSNSKTWGFYVI